MPGAGAGAKGDAAAQPPTSVTVTGLSARLKCLTLRVLSRSRPQHGDAQPLVSALLTVVFYGPRRRVPLRVQAR